MNPWIAETESLDWASEATVTDERVIENVALAGNVSLNGYEIPASAFVSDEHVRKLYENKLVFINHLPPEKRDRPRDRSMEELAGFIKNARLVNGRPMGDIHTKGAAKGELLANMAEANIPNVGMSHVAIYRFNSDKTVVERVEDVATVDAVVFPATTKTFSEQATDKDGDDQMAEAHAEKLLDRYQQENKKLMEDKSALDRKLAEERASRETLEAAVADLNEKVKQLSEQAQEVEKLREEKDALIEIKANLESERDGLQAKVDEYEAEKALHERKKAIYESLRAHSLDPDDRVVVSESFSRTLMKCEDDAEREQLIKDRAELVQNAVEGKTDGAAERRREPDKKTGFDFEKEVSDPSWFVRV